ncbi:hypothetical protein CEXT_505161 [Caerostris extrusa]|uniref:Uncharacterized protein n=1 Tax=Caerostris extrusa TaxID=172846 RepID=A0AAV4WH28_CAEEX|nr:hypothetical protein CEXT_505161 [Caerostris extrusa]
MPKGIYSAPNLLDSPFQFKVIAVKVAPWLCKKFCSCVLTTVVIKYKRKTPDSGISWGWGTSGRVCAFPQEVLCCSFRGGWNDFRCLMEICGILMCMNAVLMLEKNVDAKCFSLSFSSGMFVQELLRAFEIRVWFAVDFNTLFK